jgi:hypothetical protein
MPCKQTRLFWGAKCFAAIKIVDFSLNPKPRPLMGARLFDIEHKGTIFSTFLGAN